ncbi:MAG TPA: phage major capsid protein [Glycomyces sp.]|nr:phage major capsid protein [Glycomyces sp.]
MPKLTLAQATALAEREGYTGNDKSAAAIKSWMADTFESLTDEDGKSYKPDEIEIEEPAPKRVVSIPKGNIAVKNNAPLDTSDPAVKSYLESVVREQMRQAGQLPVQGRPAMVPGAEVETKSAEQRMYEDRIKFKQAFFSDWRTAIMAKSWLASHYLPQAGRVEEGIQAHKSFLELHEKVAGKAYTTTGPTSGAPLVPDYFMPDLIRNVTEAGVARKLAKVVQMPESQIFIPRRTGGMTGYFLAENQTITETEATYDNVTLNAKTFLMLSKASEQMFQDSGLPFLDITFQEMATTLAQMEDDCLLIATGTGTYGGMTGFERKYGTTATDGGYVVVGGADASAHTQAQVVNAIARVPQYARKNMVITIHHNLKPVIFDRLSTSTPGGLTLTELTGFGLVQSYMNVPIIENNSMSSVVDAGANNRAGFTAGDQIDFLIGDFSRAALFGDRLAVEMTTSRERYFDQYAVAIRLVKRFHINVHSVGTSSVAGPVVSFWQT